MLFHSSQSGKNNHSMSSTTTFELMDGSNASATTYIKHTDGIVKRIELLRLPDKYTEDSEYSHQI